MRGTLIERANLNGKVAIVTGGAGGLGESISLALADCGVSVAVCDRDEAALDQLTAQLGDDKQTRLYRHLDVRDYDALEAFFGEVDDHFGRLDILVNVPGGGFNAELLDLKPRGWEALIAQNFTHVLHACQLAGARMRASGSGNIVNISSIEAHRGAPTLGLYGAMKAAITSLTKTLALELGPYGVRVNNIAPDVFPTPASIAAGWNTPEPYTPREQLGQRIGVPLGRFGRRDELADCVLFLVSDLAAYVTGITLHADGGTHAAGSFWNWPDGYRVWPPDDVVDQLLPTQGSSE